MAEIQIKTAQNIVEAALHANETFGGLDPWWRGHSVASWNLCPSVFRVDDGGYLYEQNIAHRFLQKARPRYPNYPDIADVPGWLHLMQHYGLPTRMLDWTDSILIAMHFAVRHEKYHSEDGAVWALLGSFLNEQQVGQREFVSVGHPPASILFKEAFRGATGEPSKIIVATNSAHNDIRMMVQLAQFTLHGSGTPIEELPKNEKFLMRFTIPSSAKEGIKAMLELFGISEASLFPDLEHLATEIRKLRFQE